MKICALMVPREMKLEQPGSAIKAMTDEDAALEALRLARADEVKSTRGGECESRLRITRLLPNAAEAQPRNINTNT
jgi:hypothetical protein